MNLWQRLKKGSDPSLDGAKQRGNFYLYLFCFFLPSFLKSKIWCFHSYLVFFLWKLMIFQSGTKNIAMKAPTMSLSVFSPINKNMKKSWGMEQKKEKTPPWGCLMCKCLAPVCFDSWRTSFVSEQNIKHVTADLREEIKYTKAKKKNKFAVK